MVAAIDVGSNTVKVLVARRGAGGAIEAAREELAATRLGEGMGRGGALKPEAIARTAEAAAGFAATARSLGCDVVEAAATEAARAAANGAELVRAFAERGIPLRIIDGEQEARLGWLAAASLRPPGPLVALDIGGGSMQITAGDAGAIGWWKRYPLGGVRLKEKFLTSQPATEGEWARLDAHVAETLRDVRDGLNGPLAGLGGTTATLAHLAHPGDPWGSPIPLATMQALSSRLRKLSAAETLALGVPRGREDIAAAAAAALTAAVARVGRDALHPCPRGLRWGLALTLLSSGS
jgi:exopolyphosphatase/guanosine-5'-triphosphate,3'-diphosphate pyrophosphatase